MGNDRVKKKTDQIGIIYNENEHDIPFFGKGIITEQRRGINTTGDPGLENQLIRDSSIFSVR